MKTIVTKVKTIPKIDTGAMKNTPTKKNIRMIMAIVTDVIVLFKEKEDVLVIEVTREKEIITTTLSTRQTEIIEIIPPKATNVILPTAINAIPLLLLIPIKDANH